MREPDIERETRGTFLGDYRVRQQQAACQHWPRASLPDRYRAAVQSAVPTLFVSGHCGLPNMWRAGLRIAPRLYSEDADTPSGAAVWGLYTSSSCVGAPRVSSTHHLARLCRGRRSRRSRRNPARGRSHRGRPRSRLALRRVLGPLSVSLLVRVSTSHLSLMRWFVTAVITGPYRGCIECAQGGLSNVRNRGA
jgi:hypothetical protein